LSEEAKRSKVHDEGPRVVRGRKLSKRTRGVARGSKFLEERHISLSPPARYDEGFTKRASRIPQIEGELWRGNRLDVPERDAWERASGKKRKEGGANWIVL